MIIAHYGHGLDAGADQEIHQNGLELGLSGLEVVATDKDIGLFGQLNAARNKGVLRGTINKGALG